MHGINMIMNNTNARRLPIGGFWSLYDHGHDKVGPNLGCHKLIYTGYRQAGRRHHLGHPRDVLELIAAEQTNDENLVSLC